MNVLLNLQKWDLCSTNLILGLFFRKTVFSCRHSSGRVHGNNYSNRGDSVVQVNYLREVVSCWRVVNGILTPPSIL